MALSRRWTVASMMKHVMAQAAVDDTIAYAQRFELLNLAQQRVIDQFYALMSHSYMTPVVVVNDTTAKYATAATSAYTVATTLLAVTDQSAAFDANDIGKLVMFRKTGDVYLGVVDAVPSSTTLTISGFNLPSGNLATIDEVLICPTPPTGTYISLTGLSIMRVGGQIKMELESTATTAVEPLSLEAYRNFRTTAAQNRNKIVWVLSGDQLLLKKGTSLSSYGTLTLRYPRVPINLTADSDYIDLPDGAATALMVELLKRELLRRFKQLEPNLEDLALLVKNMYNTFATLVQTEEIEQKTQALS